MKVRRVCPKKQREAEEIMEVVADYMDVPVRTIRSKSNQPDVVEARKFCVFFMRGNTLLQRDLIAQMVGYSRPEYVSTVFTEVYRRRQSDKDRTFFQRLEQLIFNK
jgi:chromosomal replication initiation ATPase DnaA